jgi:hypothetical protein
MSNFSSSYDLNNNQLLLINILNTMYNDNIRQINNYNDSISILNQTNIQIRNLLFQIFYNSNNNSNNISNNISNNNTNNNTNNHTNNISNNNSNINQNYSPNNRDNNTINEFRNTNSNNLGRVILNNIPYVIENIEEYRIPLTRDRNETLNTNLSQLLLNFFQPVEVFPTQLQIDIATRIVIFNDIISPRNRSCPISLENFNDSDLVTIIRFCGHIFNTDELNTWFRSNCRCPVCRYDIRTFREVNRNENIQQQSENINIINETQINNEDINIERSEYSNNNTINSSPLINRFLNEFVTQENGTINLFTDLSGNLLNSITNSDSLLRLFNSVNNNFSI